MQNLLLGIFFIVAMIVNNPIPDDLTTAFQKGNSNEISKYFGNSVDLSISGNEGVYSKIQAKLILKTFFLKNQPSDFKVLHNGDSKNNSHYSIGNLITNKGNYRVYVLYSQQESSITILELKIESDE
jgi:hypothetical protein